MLESPYAYGKLHKANKIIHTKLGERRSTLPISLLNHGICHTYRELLEDCIEPRNR